jgi:hypothetical protein
MEKKLFEDDLTATNISSVFRLMLRPGHQALVARLVASPPTTIAIIANIRVRVPGRRMVDMDTSSAARPPLDKARNGWKLTNSKPPTLPSATKIPLRSTVAGASPLDVEKSPMRRQASLSDDVKNRTRQRRKNL